MIASDLLISPFLYLLLSFVPNSCITDKEWGPSIMGPRTGLETVAGTFGSAPVIFRG